MDEKILITVDIASNEKTLIALTAQLQQAKAEMQALTKANSQGRLSNDELAAATVRYKAQTAAITGEIKTLTNANNQQIAANKAAAGSVQELSAKSKLLTTQYNSLSEAERTNTKAGRELSAELRRTNDALIAAGKNVSDGRRSVGLYAEAIKEATSGIKVFGIDVGQTAGNLGGKLTQGLDLAKKGFGSLKAAVASTGIGLLLLAFTSLFEYFKKTDEGAETIKAVFAGVGAAINTVSGVVISFGKALASSASDPKQAFEDLVGFLETNVANRFKAFGLLIDAIRMGNVKELGNGIIQLTTGIQGGVDKAQQLRQKFGDIASEAKRAALVAYDLSRAEDTLDDSRRDAVVQLERERNAIDKLVLSARDRSLSEQKRLANLDQASQLETKGLQVTTALASEKLRIIRLQNAEAERTGKLQDEQRDAAVQAEAEVVRLAGQSATLQQTISNRRAGLLEQAAADRKAAAAAALEQRRDEVRARQTRLELLLLDVQKGSVAELAIKKQQVEAARDLELIAEKQTADQKKLIRAKALGEIKSLQDDFTQKAIEAAQKEAAEEAKAVAARAVESNREYTDAQKNLEDYLNTKRAAIERDQAAGIISEIEAQKRLNAVQKAGNDAALVNAADYGKDQGGILKKAADDELKRRNQVKAEKKRIQDAEFAIEQSVVQSGIAASDAVIAALGEETAAGQIALGAKKVFALAEIAINLEKQLSLNKVAAAELNAVLPGSGIIYEITADAAAIAAAIASSAKIAGFKRGGYVSGPGTGTSDSITARLSNGESVMNANTTAMFPELLSHLNVLGGGVAFATGGLVPGNPSRPAPIADGGFLARQLGGYSGPSAKEIAYELARVIPSEINVKSITKAQGSQAKIQGWATLG